MPDITAYHIVIPIKQQISNKKRLVIFILTVLSPITQSSIIILVNNIMGVDGSHSANQKFEENKRYIKLVTLNKEDMPTKI